MRGLALPVEVVGPAHVAAQVGAWVESRLGWQVTDGAPLPAVVRLVAAGGARSPGPRVGGDDGCPTVGLVGPDDDPWEVAKLAAAADAVVAWPAGHDDLEGVVAGLVGGHAEAAPGRGGDLATGGPGVLVVGGACGGVGTTTVAITLAARHVWARHGGRALAITSGPTPVPGIRVVAGEVVSGHRGWAAGVEVADVPGLRVVRSAPTVARLRSSADVAVVVDRGVVDPADEDVDVVVVRRDAAGLHAATEAACGTIVVADDGPVARTRMVAACAGRQVVVVPWSVRVARAHALGRVPGSLPGRYTAAFTPISW